MNEEIKERLEAIRSPVVDYIDDPVTFYRSIIQAMRVKAAECLQVIEENEQSDSSENEQSDS